MSEGVGTAEKHYRAQDPEPEHSVESAASSREDSAVGARSATYQVGGS